MPSADSIRAVFFDLGNVLMYFDWNIALERLRAAGTVDPKAVRTEIIQNEIYHQYECGRLSTAEFMRELLECSRFSGTLDELESIWNEIFTPMDTNLDLLARLKTRYITAILSNTNAAHIAYLQKHFDLSARVHHPLYSYELGLRKPGADFFQAALNRTALQPSQCVFIDDLLENVHGARAVGLHTVHYQTGETDLERELARLGVGVD
ncbi:MAG: HAD family phosphatase [Leptospiraceae bacterium]|nr:HAD family phosphatase [Leptospiraceae bacterium]MCB1319438.1 HAD family phosphatase [Leptospiraceae bacterium]